ncbi:MAG: transcriptional regulator GcvA [Pseudomonadota bacterium]
MHRSLPPLNALRAFEASARHLSFTRAADELFVTQTAVSHQIKALEEYLGAPLFKRLPRRLLLTDAGNMLLDVATPSLDAIAEVSEEIRNPTTQRKLTVSVTPAFGTQWLVPRLGRFWRAHPDIELKLDHSVTVSDFTDGVDIAVRAAPKSDWPGTESELLMKLDLMPVCAPILADGRPAPSSLEQLADYPLLHEESYEDWNQWAINAGVTDLDVRHGPLLGDHAATIAAALNGDGLALVRNAFVQEHLASARLTVPFEVCLRDTFCYFIVYPRGSLANPTVRSFRDFLFDEHGRDSQSA